MIAQKGEPPSQLVGRNRFFLIDFALFSQIIFATLDRTTREYSQNPELAFEHVPNLYEKRLLPTVHAFVQTCSPLAYDHKNHQEASNYVHILHKNHRLKIPAIGGESSEGGFARAHGKLLESLERGTRVVKECMKCLASFGKRFDGKIFITDEIIRFTETEKTKRMTWILTLLFGTFLLIAVFIVSVSLKIDTKFQEDVAKIITACGTGAFTHGISGALSIELPLLESGWIKATGPLAAFVLVLFMM